MSLLPHQGLVGAGGSGSIAGDSQVLPGRLWVSLRAAVTSGGQTCASFAVVQIAIRSPCLASSQGRLLTVPQTVAKVDDEACGPRAEQ